MPEEGAKERRILEQEEEQKSGKPSVSTKKGEAQRPRVFYRRETEAQPLVVAKSNQLQQK